MVIEFAALYVETVRDYSRSLKVIDFCINLKYIYDFLYDFLVVNNCNLLLLRLILKTVGKTQRCTCTMDDKICLYESEYRACDVESFCPRVKWGLLRVAGYVAWIAASSVVMPEMVEEEDDVGRGGCC